MAGHSQFKNIMHRKGAQDAKRAQRFNKLAREITVSAKSGLPDPAANPRLRAAILAARGQNMPRDRIERAIKQGTAGGDGADYETIRYEGYGPGGTALIVETLTDNRNRTAADLRSIFAKNGGTMGETGSVAFMFDRLGVVQFAAAPALTLDALFEAAVEAGAENVEALEDGGFEVTSTVEAFGEVRDQLEARFGQPEKAALEWRAHVPVTPDDEAAEAALDLIEALDDHDDVQTVVANLEVSEALAQKLTA